MLAGCVGCSCVLLRLFGISLSLPKVASHGGDVGDTPGSSGTRLSSLC